MMAKCKKELLIIFFLAFVLCAAFIDHIKVSDYYLFEVLLGLSCMGTLVYALIYRKVLLVKHYILIPFFLLIVWSAS